MIKLNIGAGRSNWGSEWDHIDAAKIDPRTREPLPQIVSSDMMLSAYADESVDVIYSSHTLEYFSRKDAESLLTCWLTKLKIGGIMYLAVPDFEAIANLYVNDQSTHLDNFIGPLYGVMGLNNEEISHKTVYDYQTLTSLLDRVGFKNIQRYNWQSEALINSPEQDDFSRAFFPHIRDCSSLDEYYNGTLISLNIKAIR